jgi:exonuclease III
LNVAHQDIDYYNPEAPHMKKSAGTTLEEQTSFYSNFISNGFIDTYRDSFPEHKSYSYYSARKGQRGYKNKEGLRIDYVLVGGLNLQASSYSASLAKNNLAVPYIMEDIWSPYSDHCPVGATIPLEF